ncbi:C40 family peptidase [Citricoccus sp.]|uniref:C40 family peptidase n=1 Tax=Citricoccus sp. TaxID=1978372 RepID=UPI0028BF593E|nr:C40 family peptidase [Citricoccus sp.]
MSKRSSAARHRAVQANSNPLEAISKAVSSNAGTVGRQAAVVAAASGLVLSIGMPAQGAAPAVRETTSIPAPGLDIERAAVTTVNVAAAKDAPVQLDRAPVTSKPAPEPEPAPEPAPAPEPEYTAASQSESTEQTEQTERSTPSESSSTSSSSSSDESQESSQESSAPRQAAAEPAPAAQSSSVGGVVGAAYAGVGVPYVYGGKTTSGWDCSGFVAWAYAQAGINIPSSTSAIRGSGLFVQTSNPKPGDLVFQNGGGHVGIYVGNGQMIGAQNPSVGTFQHSVTRNPLMGYYTYVG